MKKIIVLLVLLSMVLTACNGEDSETTSTATGRFTGEVIEVLGNEVTIEGRSINIKDMEERMNNATGQKQGNQEGITNKDSGNFDRESMGMNSETETLVVTIPIGIEIVELQFDEEGNMTEEEASLTDIKKGKQVNIEYEESLDTILKVSIIDTENGSMFPGTGGGMKGMGTGGGMGGGRK